MFVRIGVNLGAAVSPAKTQPLTADALRDKHSVPHMTTFYGYEVIATCEQVCEQLYLHERGSA